MSSGAHQLFSETVSPTSHRHFVTWCCQGHFPTQPKQGNELLCKSKCGNCFKFRDLSSILLGKRSMTGNDFREDGWQKTKMRKPEHWRGPGGRGCEFRSCSRLASINPRGQGPGRTGGHLRVGFSLKIMGRIRPQASSPTLSLSKSELFYNCTRMRVIFTCQASIRYQTQRTKINLKEQRRLVEGARCFPACQSVKATLCAGRCSHHVTFKSNPGLKDEIMRSL